MKGDLQVYQCPLCKAWQIDYTLEALSEFVTLAVEDGQIVPNPKPAYDVVSRIVEGHVRAKHPRAMAGFVATGRL